MHYFFGDKRSFERAIDEEISKLNPRFRSRFLHQSVYEPHVRRLLETFDRSQILILKAEDYFARVAETVDDIYQFLELPPHTVDADFVVILSFNLKYKEQIKLETKEKLKQYFRQYNKRLFNLIGKNYGWNDA